MSLITDIALQFQVSPLRTQNNGLRHTSDSSVSTIPHNSLGPTNQSAKNVFGQDSVRDALLWDNRTWCAPQRGAAYPKPEHRAVDGGLSSQGTASSGGQLGMRHDPSLPRPLTLIDPPHTSLQKYPASGFHPLGDGFVHKQTSERNLSPRERVLQILRDLRGLNLPNHHALIGTGPQFGAHEMRTHVMREGHSRHNVPSYLPARRHSG
jgi:hypothetical protein